MKIIVIILIVFILIIIIFHKKLKKFGFKIPNIFEAYFENREIKLSNSNGGKGGDAKAIGKNSVAVGGKGGEGGPGGKGGDGGTASVIGDNSFAMGGEGGEAGQTNRGGRGGRSPIEILGIENRKLPDGTFLWDYGRGGDGGNPPDKSN